MNNPDFSLYLITALLPLSAFLLVIQVNPFHALVIRGILGAIATLVYAILGAGDVALTEALMGTLLAITLYVIAVRSSLVMKLGVLETDFQKETQASISTEEKEKKDLFLLIISNFKKIIRKYYLRLELLSYKDINNLEKALQEKEVHGICFPINNNIKNNENLDNKNLYETIFRIERLYEIISQENSKVETNLSYVNIKQNKEEN